MNEKIRQAVQMIEDELAEFGIKRPKINIDVFDTSEDELIDATRAEQIVHQVMGGCVHESTDNANWANHTVNGVCLTVFYDYIPFD